MSNNKKRNINFFKQDNNKRLLASAYNFFKKDLWINGKIINKFEQNIINFNKTNHYVTSCNSGTDALKIALQLDKKKNKDIYITTPFSYIATSSVIKSLGMEVIYTDINEDNFLLNLEKLDFFLANTSKKILKRISGIINVELFGYTINLIKLKNIARRYNLTLIGDCAQSFGTRYNNLSTVNYYDYSAFSFYPTKILSAYGDSGLLVIKDKRKLNMSIFLKNNGHSFSDKTVCKVIGNNSRMDSFQAYILNNKIRNLKKIIKKKKKIFLFFLKNLNTTIKFPKFSKKIHPNYYIFSFYLEKKIRKKFIQFMNKKNIQCQIFYSKLLSENKILRPIIRTNLQNANLCKNTLVSIPSHQELSRKELSFIVKEVNFFFKNIKN